MQLGNFTSVPYLSSKVMCTIKTCNIAHVHHHFDNALNSRSLVPTSTCKTPSSTLTSVPNINPSNYF